MRALAALAAIFALAGSALAQTPSMTPNSAAAPTRHITTICASGCDATSTSYVVKGTVTASYCGGGGTGGGGAAAGNQGGGGGGGPGITIADEPIYAQPGTTLTLNSAAAGASGPAAGTQGTNGVAQYWTWTQGAWTFQSDIAWGGQGGAVGTATNGGAGGAPYCAITGGLAQNCNAGTSSSGGTPGVTGTGAGAAGGTVVGTLGTYRYGAPGSAGGGPSSAGGLTRLANALNSTTGAVNGGAASTLNGGGGAGGSAYLPGMLGGSGGSGAPGAGNAGGTCSGGGGGSSNGAGGGGGKPWAMVSDVY